MSSPEMSSAGRKPGSPKLLYWIVAMLFAAVLLYFSLRGIHWQEVWAVLSHAKLNYIALAIGFSTFSLLLRAVRWRVLLRAEAPVSVATAFWATAAGYFGNNFLPARAGEVVRSLMVSRASGLSKTFVLTTALSERLCDAISLVLISSVVLLTLPVKPGWFAHAATPFAILGLGGAVGIAILPRLPSSLCQKLLGLLPIPAAVGTKLLGIFDQVLVGMRSFHDVRRLSGFISLTAIIWFSDAVSTVFTMHALGLPGTIPIALLLITGLGLGSALPSTPGYVGIYQFVAVSVLTPFGFSKSGAIAYILLAQGLQYALITIWGLIGMSRARQAHIDVKHATLDLSGAPELANSRPVPEV